MKALLLALLAVCAAARAGAAVFDFETTPLGASSSVTATDGGLTLTVTSPGGSVLVDNSGVPLLGSRSVTGSTALKEDFFPLVFTFSATVSSVTFLFGDGGGDDDSPVYISAYTTSSTLLGTLTETYPAGYAGGKSAVWSGDGAAYFVVGTTASASGSNPNSLYFEIASASRAGTVPDTMPTLGALVVSLVGLALLRSKRSQA